MSAHGVELPANADVVVIGGGPVGIVAAMAQAKIGKRVVIIEANPKAARRLAGEWLHPPAIAALESVGLPLPDCVRTYDNGRGFVVFPDDDSDPMALPYGDGLRGVSVEHHVLVETLREAAIAHPQITYADWTRVIDVTGQQVTVRPKGQDAVVVTAPLIIGADGRASVARKSLGLSNDRIMCSRMAGVLLPVSEGDVPFNGFGHVFLSGPGPILAYRIGLDEIRLCIDVPLNVDHKADGWWRPYAAALPQNMGAALAKQAQAGGVQWARNQALARTTFGRTGLVLVGDAAGHYHPLTAAGMTLGFVDAVALAAAPDFKAFARRRRRGPRVAEMLAVVLYEVFASDDADATAIRKAVYAMWRKYPAEKVRTMGYLSGTDSRVTAFGRTFSRAAGIAVGVMESGRRREALSGLVKRMRWLAGGMLHLSPTTATHGVHGQNN